MESTGLNLAEAAANFDRAAAQERLRQADPERQAILERFPLVDWPRMPLERFALGQEESQETFGRWLEFRSHALGSMRGGSARKHIS